MTIVSSAPQTQAFYHFLAFPTKRRGKPCRKLLEYICNLQHTKENFTYIMMASMLVDENQENQRPSAGCCQAITSTAGEETNMS